MNTTGMERTWAITWKSPTSQSNLKILRFVDKPEFSDARLWRVAGSGPGGTRQRSWKRIPNKYGHVKYGHIKQTNKQFFSGIFSTPSPTSPRYANLRLFKLIYNTKRISDMQSESVNVRPKSGIRQPRKKQRKKERKQYSLREATARYIPWKLLVRWFDCCTPGTCQAKKLNLMKHPTSTVLLLLTNRFSKMFLEEAIRSSIALLTNLQLFCPISRWSVQQEKRIPSLLLQWVAHIFLNFEYEIIEKAVSAYLCFKLAIFERKFNRSIPYKPTVTSTKNIRRTKRSQNVEVRCRKLPALARRYMPAHKHCRLL